MARSKSIKVGLDSSRLGKIQKKGKTKRQKLNKYGLRKAGRKN